jgi:hypothetical protein
MLVNTAQLSALRIAVKTNQHGPTAALRVAIDLWMAGSYNVNVVFEIRA